MANKTKTVQEPVAQEPAERELAANLPCIFSRLVSTYNSVGLKKCGTKLVEIQTYLEDFSICERHYNQLIASNYFHRHLLNLNSERYNPKRQVESHDSETEFIEKQTCEIGTQVEKQLCEVGVQTSDSIIQDLENYVILLQEQLNKKISEIEDLRKHLDCAYDYVWENHFSNQEKRIDSIVQIAAKECQNVYNDIDSLILNKDQFSLNNLLNFTPNNWLANRNPVIVNFIEVLTHNNESSNNDSTLKEKLFKKVVAVDAIYGSRHKNYVSEINLTLSAIKYSLAQFRMIVDIDNHVISSGSYIKFINWLESLAIEQEPMPEGLLFLAFDNEQRGQYNYLDREYNTVIYHTVTSFVAFNIDKKNLVQFTTNPWCYNLLNNLQYKELYYLTPEMKTECELELNKYLLSILNELINEKRNESNIIDTIIKNQKGVSGHSKWCKKCNTTNIDNRKHTCPNCNKKLDTLAALRAESTNESFQISNTTSQLNPIIIKPNTFTHEQKTSFVERISITQKLEPDQNIIVPEMHVPDPLGLNPNSINNVKKVLEHIQNITKINKDGRKWLLVICDEVPYHLAQKIKKDFPWAIDIKQFAIRQRYRTENQLKFFKKCADYHKSWNSICDIYRHAMTCELLWPYVVEAENPSVDDYLDWVKKQDDCIYKLKFEQTFVYLQAIVNFRTGVRNNRPSLRNAARRIFAPIWSGRRHPIYRYIEIVELYSVISWSGYCNQHQGFDAILEEINKYLKALILLVPSQRYWNIAARNCTKFIKRFRVQLRKTGFLNPQNDNRRFKSLEEEYLLSEQLKNFSNLVCERRIAFIKETFENNKPSLPRPIPVTEQEEKAAMSEEKINTKYGNFPNCNKNLYKFKLTSQEEANLHAATQFLELFYETTNVLSSSTYITLGISILLINDIIDNISSYIHDSTSLEFLKEATTQMSRKIQKYTNEIYDKIAFIAAILNPQIKLELISNDMNTEANRSIFDSIFRTEYSNLILNSLLTNLEVLLNLIFTEQIVQKKHKTNTSNKPDEFTQYLTKDYLAVQFISVPSEQ
ncbi:5489_t:CDS:10, partial [Scutellospora calospora]